MRRAIFGYGKLTVGDAALTGIVWALSLDEAGSVLQLHCPPILRRWLASKFLDYSDYSTVPEDVYLASTISEAIPYHFKSGLQGEGFQDHSLIAEVCRQNLLFESTYKVCNRLHAVL